MDVLLVEDDPTTRLFLEGALEGRGHAVTSLEDAESAISALERREFPLILIDWLLPGMDGLELCRRIRRRPDGDAPVIIVETVRDQQADLQAVLEAGADDYIAKPLVHSALGVRLSVAERNVAASVARQAAEQASKEVSRLEGALLAARTVQHYLGNELALALGYCDMLATEVPLPEEHRVLAEAALEGLVGAMKALERLGRITRLEEAGELVGPAFLDLELSVSEPVFAGPCADPHTAITATRPEAAPTSQPDATLMETRTEESQHGVKGSRTP